MNNSKSGQRIWPNGRFNSSKWDTRIRTEKSTARERWLGFFIGPGLVYIAYYILGGTYLNTYYTDILNLTGVGGGVFLTLLPIISKVIDAITNVIMGQIIDHTRTRQGKARPWLLISLPFCVLSSILLYSVPSMSTTLQAIWIAITYNLFFAFSFTIYNMSATLTAPLSSRDTKDRDKISLFFNLGTSMIPGTIGTMLFPLFFINFMGADKGRWTLIMSIMGCLCIPGILIQYYLTKERVTESSSEETASKSQISLVKQIRTCFSDKYWVIFFIMITLYQFANTAYTTTALYYARWVLGTYETGGTIYSIMNAIGQFPLGIGVFLLWPLVKKFGKRRVYTIGMVWAAIFCAAAFFLPTGMKTTLPMMFMRSFGLLPSYLNAAIMAEAMDHIEYKFGYRCDGFTATVNSVMMTAIGGLVQGALNAGLAVSGYQSPLVLEAAGKAVVQSGSVQAFLRCFTFLIPAIAFAAIAVAISRFDIDDHMEEIQNAIAARKDTDASDANA